MNMMGTFFEDYGSQSGNGTTGHLCRFDEYIRDRLLQKYLSETGQTLTWAEMLKKYGNKFYVFASDASLVVRETKESYRIVEAVSQK